MGDIAFFSGHIFLVAMYPNAMGKCFLRDWRRNVKYMAMNVSVLLTTRRDSYVISYSEFY